jgi:replication factor C small subunit
MTENTPLHLQIFTEKYRPQVFDEVIIDKKSLIQNYLKNPNTIPSFLFSSAKAGTGKTSTAKIIAKALKCDILSLNSSDERGIDTVRDKIKSFAESMSSLDGMKRCIFMDEADRSTSTAQDALKNIIETYSDNCFFIFTCNDISKITEPIRSRCVLVNFDKPDKKEIKDRLKYICEKEAINDLKEADFDRLINLCYPDIRTMIVRLQNYKVDKQDLFTDDNVFHEFAKKIKAKDVKYIYDQIYSGQFNILEFNKWYFQQIFEKLDEIGLEKASKLTMLLADTEKNWTLGANIDIVFLNNILQIINLKILG